MAQPLEAVRRAQFPALADKTFLDAACASLAPQAAADAIAALLRDVQTYPERSATAFHIRLDAARDAARPAAARLIGARPEDIALVENTSHGLAIAAAAIPLEAGDNILVPDLEYLQVPLPWRQQPAAFAPEIRLVPHADGTLPVDRFAAAADGRTRAVVMSSVQWSNGFRADLDAIGAFCRERRMWFVVDGIQQLGAFPVDVGRTPVDILVTGGHKWLNAPFGAGFMYINPAVRDRLRPSVAGYLSVTPPAGGWAEYFRTPSITPLQPVTFTADARRYETGGTGNYPGAAGLAASLDLINRLRPAAIADHILGLTDLLVEGLSNLPVRIVTPRDPACRSGIVTFSLGSVAREAALIERLLDARVLVSHRYTSGVGGVRVSCHFFNAQDDVTRLLEVTGAWLSASAPAP
ncbi:MAG: aminotransferase class V-fold PLP-dependent enzyme [Vicinamibacterales bacterium]